MQDTINDFQLSQVDDQLRQPLLENAQQQQPHQLLARCVQQQQHFTGNIQEPDQPLPGFNVEQQQRRQQPQQQQQQKLQRQQQHHLLENVQVHQPGRSSLTLYGSLQQPPTRQGYNPPQQQGYFEQGMQRGGRQQVDLTFMPAPGPINGCPPGLEYLTQIDQLFFSQQVDFLEMVTRYVAVDRFQIKNALGQQVYFSNEGIVKYTSRTSMNANVAVHIVASLCTSAITMIRSCLWTQGYEVLDANSHLVFTIECPCCWCQIPSCRNDVEFKIRSRAGKTVGKICKRWGGWARETLTVTENFSLHFPMDLDVKMKAVLLGAVFLMDLMHFERKLDRSIQGTKLVQFLINNTDALA